jgi:hypothetical protein
LDNGDNGRFSAGSVWLNDPVKNRNIFLEEVVVDKLVVNEANGSIQAEGINWQKADIKITPAINGGTSLPSEQVIELKRIRGNNTSYSGTIRDKTISTKLNTVSLDLLKKQPGEKIVLDGLEAEGQQLNVSIRI